MAKLGNILVLLISVFMSSAIDADTMSIDDHTPTPLNLIPWLSVTHLNTTSELADIQALPKTKWHQFTSDDIQRLSQHNFWLTFSIESGDESLSRILALDNP